MGKVGQMWGTDGIGAWTEHDAQALCFVVFNSCTDEMPGVRPEKPADPFEAPKTPRQAAKRCYGGFAKTVAWGAVLHYDDSNQFVGDAYQVKSAVLGMSWARAFVTAIEGDPAAESANRTLQEQPLWVRGFGGLVKSRYSRKVCNVHWLNESVIVTAIWPREDAVCCTAWWLHHQSPPAAQCPRNRRR